MKRAAPLLLFAVFLFLPVAAAADDGTSFDVGSSILGIAQFGLTAALAVIGWFTRGVVQRAEDTAKELTEAQRKIAVLEERVHGIGKLEEQLNAFRSEVLGKLSELRSELREDRRDRRGT